MTLTNNPAFAVCLMLAGFAAAAVWYGFRLKKEHLPSHAALAAAAAGALLALVCAKAGYLLHDMGANLFEGYFDEVTAFDPAMFSFVAGAAGFSAGVAVSARISGIRPMEALDLFAAPGCAFIFLARIAEGGMDTIGIGGEVTAEWLRFFPLAMKDSWGDAYLAVFVLEALWALVCLVPALQGRKTESREGDTFRRTAVWLLGAQIGFEMLLTYPYIRSFYTSFVSLEQILCAILFMVIAVCGCRRNRNWKPVIVSVALLLLSMLFQFYRDNKIVIIFEEGWEWALDNKEAISRTMFLLISVGLILAGERSIRLRKGKM